MEAKIFAILKSIFDAEFESITRKSLTYTIEGKNKKLKIKKTIQQYIKVIVVLENNKQCIFINNYNLKKVDIDRTLKINKKDLCEKLHELNDLLFPEERIRYNRTLNTQF